MKKLNSFNQLVIAAALLLTAISCNGQNLSAVPNALVKPLSLELISGTVSVSSEPYGGFSKANLTDNNLSTSWSSQLYSDATHTEWVDYRFNTVSQINFVKLETRFYATQNRALGFPVNFRVLALDTGAVLAAYTSYATPNTNAAVTLSFSASTVAGVRIEATQLGTEDNNSYVFQIAEVSAGNDTGDSDPGSSGAVSVSSEPYAGFSKSNLTDGNTSTSWSSQLYSTANQTEFVEYRFSAVTRVNFVKLETRFFASQNRALGFPVDFRIIALDTGAVLRTFTNFPTPNSAQPIILSFAGTNIAGVRIEATKLGTEDNNSHVFQLSELSVGNNPTYDKFAYLGNSASVNVFEVRGIGSGAFNPARMSNWVFDERRSLITANNIYAPSIVKNNGTWNIYFGGWNDSNQNDKVYLQNSRDDFLTFQNPDGSANSVGTTVIQQGVFIHTNNESVIKVGSNDWRMLLTTYPVADQNKPMYATSSDGINFTPNAGTLSNNITMTGYPNWADADVNGGNVLYFENGVYHMYFVDFNNFAVHHATSTDFVNYTYQGVALNEGRVINDFKRFDFGGTAYYMAVTHVNRGSIRASVSTNLNTLPPSATLFSSKDAQDAFITSVGLVTDGNRLLGAIYGAANQGGLDNNRLFAVWLQKKVLFTNSTITWGEGGSSFGPDRFKVGMTQPVQTGQLKIFDTDGTTLLTESPDFTVVQGDIWDYRP